MKEETMAAPETAGALAGTIAAAAAATGAAGEGGTKVVCRVRPRTKAEEKHKSCVLVRGREVRVNDVASAPTAAANAPNASGFTGTFDEVFDQESTNDQIFDSLLPTLDDVRRGYNGAILAYGQSGAGKTHTMNGHGGGDGKQLGIIPRVSSSC